MIFVVALATGAWRFVTLGTAPDEGPLIEGLLINTLLFGVFALHHSVLARGPVKARVTRLVTPPLERPTYVWVASLLFIGVCIAWRPIAGTLYRMPPPWAWAVGTLQFAGGLLTLDAARRIDVRSWPGCGLNRRSPANSSREAPTGSSGIRSIWAGCCWSGRHPT